MADTTFSAGTVITSTWLNDVNDVVYTDAGGVTGLGSTTDASKGDALLGVKLTDTGSVGTTQHTVNQHEPRNPKLHFGSPWDNTTTSAVGLQNAVNGALASRGEVYLPEGNILVDSVIELNDQAATGNYRQSLRIYGAGKKRTRLIHRNSTSDAIHGRALFQHKLTQTQGDNNYFAQGLEIAHLEIYGDGSTHAAAVAISLEGAYNPWLHDLHIDTMGTGGGIVTPGDSRFSNPDRYSCADVICERVTVISTQGAYGIKNQCFATAWKILPGCYIVSNTGGGVYLEGCNHHIAANSIAGNGSASGYGLYFARSSDGTPRNCVVDNGIEFDGNYTNQLRTNGFNTVIRNVRFLDTVSGGAFLAPIQVQVIALTGQSADSNTIHDCVFDFRDMGAANVTAVSFDLDNVADRTVRYNVSERNTYLTAGATTGVVTECSFGTNPTHSNSLGNRHYTLTKPRGYSVVGNISYDIATASGTTVVTGLGFRPQSIEFDGFVASTQMVCIGKVDSDQAPGNRGMYYYPTGATWNDTGANRCLLFRTAAGDIADGYVSAMSDDGFTITWTKTGSPTGTATIKYVARR